MTSVFARDFDLEMAEEQERQAYEARATVTPEELDAAIAAALAEGYEAGHAEGRAEGLGEAAGDRALRDTEALEALGPRLDALFSVAAEHRAALETQTLDFVLSVCEQTFPELIRDRARDRATSQIRRTISMTLGSPKLRIFVAPAAEPTLRPMLEDDLDRRGYEGVTEIAADPGLVEGDTRVEWDNGFMDYSFAAVCDRLLAALRRSRDAATQTTPIRSDACA